MKSEIVDKKAIVFGLDDVLFPEKDYLLQVYYLFSEFMGYTEQMDSSKLLELMTAVYQEWGSKYVFEKAAERFPILPKYQENFNLLHQNARLPLKLLLYANVLSLLQTLVVDRKEILLLIDGDPVQQINKIKQMEWHGLEQHLKVYFTTEFEPKPSSSSFDFILQAHQLNREEVLLVGNSAEDREYAVVLGVKYFSIQEILSPVFRY